MESNIIRAYGDLSPSRILRYFIEHAALEPNYKPTEVDSDGRVQFKKAPWTFIILGRSGPTGKTWLCRGLRNYGFHAIELSESVLPLVDYRGHDNRVIKDDIHKAIIIILNRSLNTFR